MERNLKPSSRLNLLCRTFKELLSVGKFNSLLIGGDTRVTQALRPKPPILAEYVLGRLTTSGSLTDDTFLREGFHEDSSSDDR
jgi:hypothetical protein